LTSAGVAVIFVESVIDICTCMWLCMSTLAYSGLQYT